MRAVAIILLLGCASIASAEEPGILVRYSFDDQSIETGPDTFAIFQHAAGHVRLASDLRYSGYQSIEVRDVGSDGDFPELQGYFPERKSGPLYFHFAMLVANPDQTLNIALAGPSHFSLTENGIAFWLKTRNGYLHHVSDSIPKRLFLVKRFAWYLVDIRYDIDRGRYDLTIREEGIDKPLVRLTDQTNAANIPESSVDKFSFVGDVAEDLSDVTYYVDDVVIGTDEKVVLGPFVAPGRRKLFIDRWREAQELFAKRPTCPPVLSLADFGLSESEVTRADLAEQLLVGNAIDEVPPELAPLASWRDGCAALTKNPTRAAVLFREASVRNPGARIFLIGELLSLVRGERIDEASKRWVELEPILRDDPRFGMLAAMIGIVRGDLTTAEQWLRERAIDPVAAREYFYVLVWKKEYTPAAAFAEAQAGRDATSSFWLERVGDARFLGGEPRVALGWYERALRLDPSSYGATTKLSDVHFVLGDAANERVYREKMYGRLRRE